MLYVAKRGAFAFLALCALFLYPFTTHERKARKTDKTSPSGRALCPNAPRLTKKPRRVRF